MFKKIKTFILIVSLTSFSTHSQINEYDKYLQNLDKASELKANNNFREALKYYDYNLKIIEQNSKIGDLNYIYLAKASIFFKQNKINKGISAVKKAIINGAGIETLDYKYLFPDSISELLHAKILPDYENLIERKFSTMKNPDAYAEIEKLISQDQLLRIHKDDFEAEGLFSNKEEYWKTIKIIDSINSKKLIELVQKYGWKREMWLILWHNRDTYKEENEVWNFFIPYINSQIEKGNLPHSFFAQFEDEKSLEESGYSIYGTLPGKVNPETVNSKRTEVYLTPLSKERIDFLNSF